MNLQPVDWLEPLIEYLWKHRKELMANAEYDSNYGIPYIDFDYPDYGGLPKKISNRLYSSHVDIIQEHLFNMLNISKTKRVFAKTMCYHLTMDMVKVK